MKLSESIRLGALVVLPCAGVVYDSKNGSGCAIGMALEAVGKLYKDSAEIATVATIGKSNYRNYDIFEQEWPWTSMPVKHPAAVDATMEEGSVINTIIELFDSYDWPPSRIADWIETIEPKEVDELAQQALRSAPTLEEDLKHGKLHSFEEVFGEGA